MPAIANQERGSRVWTYARAQVIDSRSFRLIFKLVNAEERREDARAKKPRGPRSSRGGRTNS